MAFVYRNSKNIQDLRPKTPAPTAYNNSIAIKPQKNNTAVTFVDRTHRQIWRNSYNPGPGQYNAKEQFNIKNNQLFHKNGSDDFLIIQQDVNSNAKGCYSSFKSRSKKLNNYIPITPGPGSYETNMVNRPATAKQRKVTKKPTPLAKFLFQQARKEGFSNKLSFADSNCKELLIADISKHEFSVINCQKSDKKKNIKSKNMNVFASKVQRAPMKRPMTSVGPGYYNIQQSYQALNSKNSAIIGQKMSTNHIYKQPIADFLKQPFSLMPQNIGPGAYNTNISSFNKKNPSISRGISCFGSLQSRFLYQQESKSIENNHQSKFRSDYKTNSQKQKIQNIKAPFMSTIPKQNFNFCGGSKYFQARNKNVSPTSYNIHNNMYDSIIKKNKKKIPKTIYGCVAQRFKNKSQIKLENKQNIQALQKYQTNHQKAPNQSNQNICNADPKKKTENKNQQPWSKSSHKAQQQSVKIDYRPICYDSSNKTLSNNFGIKVQQDAPFMTITQRFKSENKDLNKQLFKQFYTKDKQNIGIVVQTNTSKNRIKSKNRLKKYMSQARQQQNIIKKTGNNNTTRMLEQQTQNYENVGPQSYHPVYPQHSKSHNVLFRSAKETELNRHFL